MSRRQRMRAAHDKRTTSLELSRFTESTQAPASEDDEPADAWLDEDQIEPDQRVQIGPLDVHAPINYERHA